MASNITRLSVEERLEIISRFAASVGENEVMTCRDCGTPTVVLGRETPEMRHDVECVFSKVRRALKLCEPMAKL